MFESLYVKKEIMQNLDITYLGTYIYGGQTQPRVMSEISGKMTKYANSNLMWMRGQTASSFFSSEPRAVMTTVNLCCDYVIHAYGMYTTLVEWVVYRTGA